MLTHVTSPSQDLSTDDKPQLWEQAKAAGLSRRTFLALLAAGGTTAVAAACGADPTIVPTPEPTSTPTAPTSSLPVTQVVLPPTDARVVPTACDYCRVGCGYKAYTWPVGQAGGPGASENALGVDFPAQVLSGKWISPNMQNVVEINGAPHYVLVIPDGDTQVVNVGGDHSVRGGTLAQKLYSKDTPTRDRLARPLLRVEGELVAISWDDALDLVAETSSHVLEKFGELAWGMKMYSYE